MTKMARVAGVVLAAGAVGAGWPATAAEPGKAPDGAASVTPRPAYKLLRYEEDFSALKDPAMRTQPLDELKYIALAADPEISLSVGGEVRTRYEYFRDPGFGLRGLSYDDYLLHRFLLHGDLKIGDHFRVFVQGISGFQWGAESAQSALQDNVMDLQQAFADVVLGEPKGDSVTIRGGRMEMAYGSFRLVTPRDPTNSRLNFDGVRATYRTGRVTVDGFLTRPVEQKRGIFNDGENDNQTFWGVYSSIPLTEGKVLVADPYYFGLLRKGVRYGAVSGTDERHSTGLRLWGQTDGWDYDVEGVLQFGTFANQDILAWTVASNFGYTFGDVSLKPRLGLKVNIASGDTSATDGKLGTFNALFPRQSYFSEIGLLAPANFFDVHPSLSIKPHETVFCSVSWNPFWRFSTDDAVYSPGRVGIPAGASDRKYVGSTLNVQADWNVTPQMTLSLLYAHFFKGSVVRDGGGSDTDFLGTWITLRF